MDTRSKHARGGASERRFAPAPAGALVRWTSLLTLIAAPMVVGGVAFAVSREVDAEALFGLGIGALVLCSLVLIWWTARIENYRVADGRLVVKRAWHSPDFALEGLAEIRVASDALRGALRTFGNGGLGAISGWFWSRSLGRFRAYVTDAARTVVMRWPDRTVVVSPERPHEFVAEVRRRVVANGAEGTLRVAR
ncbi:hypothetical protein ASA1KI_02100 [Opitutales bacterium ASA1]|uniref:PH domain-containing protein n=1 Tax=Congregicoccus parvus TaxID=3081749 RepID=UPI002B29C1A5|nr:hypothetical protein ASA1KI_02100 [Opitutales bacterium ASA1]